MIVKWPEIYAPLPLTHCRYDEGIVRAHRAAAGKKKKGEYLADIDREAAKLKKRGTIIMQMMDIMEVDHGVSVVV